MPNQLSALSDLVAGDPGLAINIVQADIDGGVAGAVLMNSVINAAIAATGVNADGRISPDDTRALSDYIRADATLYAQFLEGHGDDEGSEETGFHLVQGDGGALRFQGRDLVDTVADAVYHIGFEYMDGRFQNEDGNQNETVADIAGWLNYFVNDENVVYGSDEAETLKTGHYSLNLTEAKDEIFLAEGGDDRVWAGDGHDTVEAGSGNDTVGAGTGDDSVLGHGGNDVVWGEEGDDSLIGGAGNDTLGGGDGDDMVSGGAGDDRVYGEAGDDRVYGGSGNDRVSGDVGDDMLHGHDGADSLWGDEGEDTLIGGTGDDDLSGGADNDKIYAGGGADDAFGATGDDRIYGQGGADSLGGGEGDDLIRGGRGDDQLHGHEDNDVIDGERGSDSLHGGDGADRLTGGKGADTLVAGEGADTLNGGRGADKFNVWEDSAAIDVLIFAAGDSGVTENTLDTVEGFRPGEDLIDLTAFGPLTAIDDAPFSGTGAEVRYEDGVLEIDADGDGDADSAISFRWDPNVTVNDLLLA